MPTPGSPDSLADATRQELGLLLDEHAFVPTETSAEVVRFQSAVATVTVTGYAAEHGQVEVIVEPLAAHGQHERLVISRMVGRASLIRVLQLAAEDLRASEQALRGEQSFFRQLGEVQEREAEAWTAFYAGEGPQPTGKLPP
jgi:hypothetical protein